MLTVSRALREGAYSFCRNRSSHKTPPLNEQPFGILGWLKLAYRVANLDRHPNVGPAYAVDLRGRGNSDGERFYVEDFEDYVSDVEAVVKMAKSRDSSLPFFLLGHSAGGVVSCLYRLDHQPELAGLTCESFSHELPAPDFALAVFKGLAHVAPHAHILHLPNERFSRDPKVVEAMNEDPLIAHETQPTRTMAALVRADVRLKREVPLITLPVLILHGSDDKNTKPSGSQHFYDMVGSADKTLKLYEGGCDVTRGSHHSMSRPFSK